MLTINELRMPTLPGVHQVILDEASAEMLKALAAAWNQRRAVSQTRRIPPEADLPRLRMIIERQLTMDLQGVLLRDRLTALWIDGPNWCRVRNTPRGVRVDVGLIVPPMHPMDWLCYVRALAVPMATWDGTSWAP